MKFVLSQLNGPWITAPKNREQNHKNYRLNDPTNHTDAYCS